MITYYLQIEYNGFLFANHEEKTKSVSELVKTVLDDLLHSPGNFDWWFENPHGNQEYTNIVPNIQSTSEISIFVDIEHMEEISPEFLEMEDEEWFAICEQENIDVSTGEVFW